MGVPDGWSALLDRSIKAFYDGDLAEGRLACDKLLCWPDLPASELAVTRTNQVHYAPRLKEIVASYHERGLTGSAAVAPTVAADGDGWLIMTESATEAISPLITPATGAAEGRIANPHTILSLTNRFDARDEPASIEMRVASTVVAGARITGCRLVRVRERWLVIATVCTSGPQYGCRRALLDLDLELSARNPGFSNVRMLGEAGVGLDGAGWMPAVQDATLHLVCSYGPTTVLRCEETTGALSLAAFRDAPLVAQYLRGTTQVIQMGDDGGLLALAYDAVTWENGTTTDLHRFVRLDREFRLTHLSHPFLLKRREKAIATGLARNGDTLALTFASEDGAVRIAAIDLADAKALLLPIEALSPGGVHSGSMPDAVLAALQYWATPQERGVLRDDLDQLPVLHPDEVIAGMRTDPQKVMGLPDTADQAGAAQAEQSTATQPSGPYNEQFYSMIQRGSVTSANIVVPHVVGLVQPKSVVDLGCGTGEWLAAFAALGINDLLGIDGDWVPRSSLHFPPDQFKVHDLCHSLYLERTFDLAVSLETGEHLPPECAPTLVASLTSAAPVILFSAAVPGQGGTDHRNLRWPRYWSELFAEHGYVTIDCIRPLICASPDVKHWYVQNTFLFVERSYLAQNAALAAQYDAHGGPPMPWVHSDYWIGGEETWPGELRRVRNAMKFHVESEIREKMASSEVTDHLERLVAELREERDDWQAQAKRHEQAAKELRTLLRNQNKPTRPPASDKSRKPSTRAN